MFWIPPNSKAANKREADSDEIWKGRLGLTTGSFIVCGLLLLQLWPTVKRFQMVRSPLNNLKAPTPDFAGFLYLVLLVDLGVWILFFAVLHVVARGLWLIDENPSTNGTEGVRTSLKNTAYYSYVGVFVLGGVIFAQLFLGALLSVSFFSFRFLNETYIGLSKNAFEILFGLSFPVAVMIGLILFNKRYRTFRKFQHLWKYTVARIPNRFLLGFSVVFGCSVVIIAYSAATIDLQVNKRIFYLSADRSVEISVELGGSTSSPTAAELDVVDPAGRSIKHLNLAEMELGGGRYAVSIPFTGQEADGFYEVRIVYSHPALDFSPPFIHGRTRRTEKFLIVR